MLLEINFTLVLFAISFLIFVYLIDLTLYKPVGKIIEARKELIASEYVKAKEYTEVAKKMLETYETSLNEARQYAHRTIEEAINLGQKVKNEKVSMLTISLSEEKAIALKNIQTEKIAILKELESKMPILADLITDKVLGQRGKTLVSSH